MVQVSRGKASVPPPDSEETFADPQRGTRRPFPSLFADSEVELTVVVPAYNEEERLAAMMDEALSDLTIFGHTFEVLVVDDGSRDATADVALGYTQRYGADTVRVLRLQQNCGKGGAVRAGAMRARGKFILFADADGATRFADFNNLMSALQELQRDGLGVVIGSRYHLESKARRNFVRKFVSRAFNIYVETVGGVQGIRDTQCGFKMFTRQAARVTFPSQHLTRWAFDVELLYLAQTARIPIREVPVQWMEIPGSKLGILKATWNMAKDLARMRYMYLSGTWRPATPAISA
mmetsp:Transcript_10782/g.21635  ORF Transcript_10782/g.21635 Transcript_10782/m.21635 type:complete len:292 (-) Transcript_10782:1198-2073(-)